MVDYSQLYKAKEWSKQEIKNHKLNISGRFNKKIYKINNTALGVVNIRNKLINTAS